jgi:hypothetical protein
MLSPTATSSSTFFGGYTSGTIIFESSSRIACHSRPSTRSGMTWSWRNSRSAPTCPHLPLSHSTPTTPLICLIPLAMVARVKDRVAIMAAIARTVEATVVVAATTRATSLAMQHFYVPPSTILVLGPSACTPIWLHVGGGATATQSSVVVGPGHCTWPDHGQPSIHTTLVTDLGSTADVHRPAAVGHISILDTLTRLVGSVVAGQLLQHNDARDATLTYGVGHRL